MATAMRTRDAVRFGFACGKVRVLEDRVFGHDTYQRLLDAPTFEDQKRLLSDTPYGSSMAGVRTAEGVESAIAETLGGFYAFLTEASLPDSVARFFRVRHDFDALRSALKSEALGIGAQIGPAAALGTLGPAAFDGPLASLPAPFGAVALEARSIEGAEGGLLGAIDALVDRAYFAEALRCAAESRSSFLVGLAGTMVDAANAKAVVRAKRGDMPVERLERMIVPGASLRPDRIGRLYAAPLAVVAERLGAMPAFRGVPAEDLSDISRLDIAAENAVVRYLRRARTVPVGPEPVVAYIASREAEAVAVRTVLMGRLAGLPAELLRSRLREFYR